MKILINILIITILSINLSLADELQVFNFTETELADLKVRKVRGADNKTIYTVGTNDNGNYLKSVADNAASGLGKEVKIDLDKTPLSNRAINYVFSSNNEVGANFPSPYTKKSIDNVLASTKDNLNEWVTVKTNVKEDFKRLHDLDVKELDGIAIMSDTDNSKMKSIAYFQNIYFSSQ
jgi:hypothetical protein